MPALSLRPSISALAALLIPALSLGCGSDSSTAPQEPQATAIVVTAADFLNGAECIEAIGALSRWSVTLYQTDHPEPAPGAGAPPEPPELTIQSAGPVDCEQGIAFGNVEVGGSYDAVILGYSDESDSEPRYRFVCGDDPEQAPPEDAKPPGAIAEYQALRHVSHCTKTLGPPEADTKVTVSLKADGEMKCVAGGSELERFEVWRNGQPFGDGEADCGGTLEAPMAKDGEIFELELLAYRPGEDTPAYGALCHARAVAGTTVAASCDPLAAEGGLQLSIEEALTALGATCADKLLDLFVTLDTGEMLEVPDPCNGTVRFSSVAPGTRELSLSAVRGGQMLSAACSAEVEPGLTSTADCSAE